MKKSPLILLGLICAVVMLLAACAPQAVEVIKTVEVEVEKEIVRTVEMQVQATAVGPTMPDLAGETADPGAHNMQAQVGRLIIKNGELKLEVEDTDIAVDRLTQVVTDVGGYIVSSRTYFKEQYGNSYKYGTLTMGVPSDQFEFAMRRLRELAIKVLDERASGQDVTDEYVDLNSRLTNLKATRDRIREFLNEAATVEEALKVNEELTAVEEEIALVQGRMNYLFDRASYSTITVDLSPYVPEPTPTVTATPRPTPTPTPWLPGETFKDASDTLGSLARGLVDALIFFGVVCVPFLIPFGALVYGVFRLGRWLVSLRRGAKKVSPQPPAENQKPG